MCLNLRWWRLPKVDFCLAQKEAYFLTGLGNGYEIYEGRVWISSKWVLRELHLEKV
ncbi:hypothetical protein ASPWEDRAFT_42373 [Aspergillus wentii DTO 134E9]|uniref:Uncharacterized protein n=1 Tax=Aspergillus wentii DTO 134E9 TaxID=1073089 RepID=A0A1L9RHF8_ASPWE|nr:uncharacterized protein ASPWEDRAFT_42373 [Aspergillus wentii DTO 134E9]OJJ34379.1 hypothetical protein ASPWEDRAFT_42373 [Aspergillus wentii DTO 134E9]